MQYWQPWVARFLVFCLFFFSCFCFLRGAHSSTEDNSVDQYNIFICASLNSLAKAKGHEILYLLWSTFKNIPILACMRLIGESVSNKGDWDWWDWIELNLRLTLRLQYSSKTFLARLIGSPWAKVAVWRSCAFHRSVSASVFMSYSLIIWEPWSKWGLVSVVGSVNDVTHR